MRTNPKLYEMAGEIDRNLREVQCILRKPLEEQAARVGLTAPQRSVLQILFHTDGLSLKELSRQVGLTHSTVSGMVDRLEKKGWSPADPIPKKAISPELWCLHQLGSTERRCWQLCAFSRSLKLLTARLTAKEFRSEKA